MVTNGKWLMQWQTILFYAGKKYILHKLDPKKRLHPGCKSQSYSPQSKTVSRVVLGLKYRFGDVNEDSCRFSQTFRPIAR